MNKNLIKDGIVDLAGVAKLLGVSESTPHQWRNRTRRGEMPVPFPAPDAPDTNGWVTRPRWRVTTIQAWYERHRQHAIGTGPRTRTRKGRNHTPGAAPKSDVMVPQPKTFMTAEERGGVIPSLVFSHAA